MQGQSKVVQQLNKVLTSELTSINQYFLHARICKNWGFEELNEHEYKASIKAMKVADDLIERILFLEGNPDVASREALRIGKDVPSMMKNDLIYELEVGQNLKKVIKICEEEQDYVSRDLLVSLLEDTEEDHTYWLEKQLGLIDKMGLQNYIQSQMS